MDLRFFWLLVFIKLTTARYAIMPKFFSQDSGVIRDAGQKFQGPLTNAHTKYRLMQQYPMYHIIPPMKPLKVSTTSTTTTSAPAFATDEFPRDLLEIAQEKLGLKSLDEIPSISELGALLGTSNSEETIKYMRQLTSTEQGIALMKAYIESSDYTDNVAGSLNADPEENREDNETEVVADDYGDTNEDNDDDDEEDDSDDETVIDLAQPQIGILQRLTNYLSGFFPAQPAESKRFERLSQLPKKQYTPLAALNMNKFQQQQQPMLVRNPLPYHYPIPIRPAAVPGSIDALRRPTAATRKDIHLNTPKAAAPIHVQLAKLVGIAPKKLEDFLQKKPKLAELATRVSRFGLPDKNSPMYKQLMSVVDKFIDQDEDLKQLLSSTDTLK